MGLVSSSQKNKRFFSSYYSIAKSANGSILQRIKVKLDSNLRQSQSHPQFLAILWCEVLEGYCKNGNLADTEKVIMIQDFFDTIYASNHTFDILFRFLLDEDRLVESLMQTQRRTRKQKHKIQKIILEVLCCASSNGLKYLNSSGIAVKPIDFPLNFMGSCGVCSRPLIVAALVRRPDIVRRLLNLGACVPVGETCKSNMRTHWPNEEHPILSLFNGCCFARNGIEDGANVRIYIEDIVCLRILLIDVPYFSQTWKKIKKRLQQLSDSLTEDNVPCLMHICRFCIRRTLKSNSNICKSNVWKSLSLPFPLDSYAEIDLHFEKNFVIDELKNRSSVFIEKEVTKTTVFRLN